MPSIKSEQDPWGTGGLGVGGEGEGPGCGWGVGPVHVFVAVQGKSDACDEDKNQALTWINAQAGSNGCEPAIGGTLGH